MKQLIHQIDEVKHDKEVLAVELEREEEFLTNTLQRQLDKVRNEKEEMEHEMLALKKQLESMIKEREHMAQQVEAEEEYLTNTMQKKLEVAMKEKSELEIALKRELSSRKSLDSNSV